MTTSDTSSKVWTDEDIRAVCNEKTPIEAFTMVLTLLQRMTIALETIARNTDPATPETLFGARK